MPNPDNTGDDKWASMRNSAAEIPQRTRGNYTSFYKDANPSRGFTAEDLQNARDKLRSISEKVSMAALISKSAANITAAGLLKLTEMKVDAVSNAPSEKKPMVGAVPTSMGYGRSMGG